MKISGTPDDLLLLGVDSMFWQRTSLLIYTGEKSGRNC